MGGAVVRSQRGAGGPLHLDPYNKQRSKNHGIGFSKAMFTPKEWTSLKEFCQQHGISQVDLNHLFSLYLDNQEAIVRHMRINLNDFKIKFSRQSKVTQEIADIFVPQLFLRPDKSLFPPYSTDEVSFARFVILGYRFLVQPIQDLIFDFIAISRKNFALKIVSTMYTFNLQLVVATLSEDLPKSSSLQYILERCNVYNMELTINDIIFLGLKYPLMFFELVHFVIKFKRGFFGDKFWSNHNKYGKSQIVELNCSERFASYKEALRYTAKSIVTDFARSSATQLIVPQDIESFQHVESVDLRCCLHIKNALGYRWSRHILEESELQVLDSSNQLINIPLLPDEDERITDLKLKQDFVFNMGTGYRAWVELYIDGGQILREVSHNDNPKQIKSYLRHKQEGTIDSSSIVSSSTNVDTTKI